MSDSANDSPPNMAEGLRRLTQISALAGHEGKMIRYMKKAMGPLADSIRVDPMGNVLATLAGRNPKAPSLMIFAHMDQLGFVVRKIEQDGYLRLERLGGVPEKSLLGQRVMVECEDGTEVKGVVGTKSHHVTPQDEKYVVVPYKDLFVDIGAVSRDEVDRMGIYVGAPVVYAPSFDLLGGRYASATSLDNRGGCWVLLEVLRRLADKRPAVTVHIVATVQEEFNLRGALPAARSLNPDLAICLDLTIAADTPDLQRENDVTLGGGPVVNLYSFHGRGTLNGVIPHPGMVKLALEAARAAELPIQRNVFMGGLTDASYVQLVGEGIPVLDLAYPCRYTHSPVETAALDDIRGLADWVEAIARHIPPDLTLTREEKEDSQPR